MWGTYREDLRSLFGSHDFEDALDTLSGSSILELVENGCGGIILVSRFSHPETTQSKKSTHLSKPPRTSPTLPALQPSY